MPELLESRFAMQSKGAARIGYVCVSLMAVLCIPLLMLRGFDGLEGAWAFNIGMDVLGTAICAIIYYSCLQASDELMEYTSLYLSLLVSVSAGLFLDECCWLVQGVAALAWVNRIANALFFANDIIIVSMFWEYITNAIDMNERLVRVVNRGVSILIGPAILVCLANLFVPIYFSVDAAGVYRRETFYQLSLAFMLFVIPPFFFGLATSQSPRKEKIVAASFAVLPIASQMVTAFNFGASLQQPATLVSMLLIYGVLVAERSKKLEAARTELGMAARIQASMMPQIFPPYPERKEFDIYAAMEPAKGVGGDFYDFFLIDDDHLCVVVADVSGKGVPASLFMMASKIILQSCAMLGSSVEDILMRTNEAICSNNDQDMFVTVWLGILEISTGKLTAANAGHVYPVLEHPGGRFELLEDKHGLPLGVMDFARYKEYEIQLEPGTKLFNYTDGVPEAMDAHENMFGMERMMTALNENPQAGPEEVLGNVRRSVGDFVQGAEQFDDITMLCLEYKG